MDAWELKEMDFEHLGVLLEGQAALVRVVDASYEATAEQKNDVLADAVEISRRVTNHLRACGFGYGEADEQTS